MDIAELLGAVFNIVLVVFIIATMVSAGFSTTFESLAGVYRKWPLVIMVLFVGFVLRPLIGWGAAELFSLETAAFIALVLMASVPGAPLGVKFVSMAGGDVVTGAAFQVLLAVVASITFAPTASLIIGAAELGDSISLPVADIIKAIAFLQILPFAVGILIRHWTPDHALEWNKVAGKIGSTTFMAVIALAILGSWQTILELIGSRLLIAAIVFSLVVLAAGYFISQGRPRTRKATGLIQPGSNSGPAFAAVAIAFNNDPAILGAVSAIVFVQIIVVGLVGSYMGKNGPEAESIDNATPGQSSGASSAG